MTKRRSDFRLGDWVVSPMLNRISKGDEAINLKHKAMAVLVRLAEANGEVVTRGEIMDSVWPGMAVSDEVLTQSIAELRKAFGDHAKRPIFIETIPRIGFRLLPAVGPVPECDSNDADETLPRRLLIPAAAAVTILATGWLAIWLADSRAPKPVGVDPDVLAVMACDNWTGDAELDYISDGLSEDIMHAARRQGIQVIGRSSTFSLKGRQLDIPTIGKNLGAAYVLTCSVRRNRQSLRISAQLAAADDNRALWTEDFDREADRVFEVAPVIAAAIPMYMPVSINDMQVRFDRRRVADPDAVDLYWHGRHYFNQLTAAGNRKAQDFYEQALAIDPDFADAHAAIAESLTFTRQFEQIPDDSLNSQIEAHLDKAIQLDDGSAEVWATYGIFMMDTYRWEEAEQALQRALDIDPNNLSANNWARQYYAVVGPAARQIPFAENAIRLDPLNAFTSAQIIFMYVWMQEYEKALDASIATMELAPNFWLTHWARAKAYDGQGEYRKMLAEVDKAIELRAPDEALDLLPHRARALAGIGRLDEARAILADLQSRSRDQYVPAISFALIHQALGNEQELLDYLEAAIKSGDWQSPFWMRTYLVDGVRDTRRYKALMERLGLRVEGYFSTAVSAF